MIDLDIQKFFDSVPWELMLKAVARHLDPEQRWVLLYVERWLKAPIRQADGTVAERAMGTPQGSAISPVLANLFMHYAFDTWMARKFPAIPFERYVDDAVVHCKTQRQAQMLVTAIGERMAEVGLHLHPAKTKIVYCRGGRRIGSYEHTAFTFLGYTFRTRSAKDKNGRVFTSFMPAISTEVLKRLGAEVRRWRLHLHNTYTLDELARWINPIVAGWMNYYGRFYRSAMYPFLRRINAYLVRWARKKYRRLRTFKKAHAWWKAVTNRDPLFFAQWRWVHSFW
ncbi:reverse transcriptase domain-containing protein [Streptosporangium sp. NBC_01469]|uniref:reverse transcriptase domain-containing protein n=1 Tax=Streptosporangium sp. NBC_01469 TaxID=2903898 RepID=UPI002E2E767E|nr:reverse transcriptase domain-containing protein [Streptosporangium sp. NBC_01469]